MSEKQPLIIFVELSCSTTWLLLCHSMTRLIPYNLTAWPLPLLRFICISMSVCMSHGQSVSLHDGMGRFYVFNKKTKYELIYGHTITARQHHRYSVGAAAAPAEVCTFFICRINHRFIAAIVRDGALSFCLSVCLALSLSLSRTLRVCDYIV